MTPISLRDHPIFICGHPKAGTSLVRAVMDSHPQLIVYPEETIFFRRCLPLFEGRGLAEQLDLADQHLIHIFTWNRENPPASQKGYPDRDYSHISFEAVHQEMRRLAEEQHRHPGDLLSAAMLAFGKVGGQARTQARWWVEKSPYNEYYAAQIFAWWPAARCVHVVRDPRDNYISYERKHPNWNAEFFAANWKRSTQAGLDNQARYSSERYWVMRYEDLAQNAETTLKKLADFLDIDWDSSLSAPTRAGSQWAGNSMFADQFQSISSAPVARWKDGLDPMEAAIIECMTRPLLASLDYPLSPSHPWQARLRAATWPLRRRLRRKTASI